MRTVADAVQTLHARKIKPSETELRHLPFKGAFIYPRLSSPAQVRESHKSIREIAELVSLAKQDGYQSNLTSTVIQERLLNIQKGNAEKEVCADGQITIDFRDLGISGRLSSNDRPGLKHLQDLLSEGSTGAVYCSDASRLTRDQTRITPYTLLNLLKEQSCRVRTPEYIKNPSIQRDWDDLADDLERGIEELKVMAGRLNRKRRQKANRGEYVGGPVPPGFIVEIKEREPSGRNIYGKYRRYPPHAEIVEKVLKEYVNQGFSEMKTHQALRGLMYPWFPPELRYMERLSALRNTKGRIEGVGYRISPSMISLLAINMTLVGVWSYGDIEPIQDNHDKVIPVELWLEAFQGCSQRIKPRGRGIKHEPLEWNGLLWCGNHDVAQRISSHTSKGAYRCQSDYVQGRGPSCLDLAAQYLDKPLTKAILDKLNFTTFAEEVLLQMEADYSHTSLEMEEQKKDIAARERRLERLEEQLGWEEGKHDRVLLRQIENTRGDLDRLRSQPVLMQPVPKVAYRVVKDFLVGLPGKWDKYSRTLRNGLLRRIIERVIIKHHGQLIEATVFWKTGQIQTIEIQRARAKGNRESHWKIEEFDILKKLWPNSSRETMLEKLPGRTWKAITHQAYSLGLQRSSELSNHTPRRRWESSEEDRTRQLYEAGTPITDIASKAGRSYTAVLQRSWEKGWQRPLSDQRMAVTECPNTKQNLEVPKRITSGLLFGGQAKVMYNKLK